MTVFRYVFMIVAVCAAWGAFALDEERMLRHMQRYGEASVQSWRAWRSTLVEAQGESQGQQLRRVNEFFNRRIVFQDDLITWQQADYWATPMETLGRRAGDCEDFALAKYFSLIELGVPRQKLRLTYVRARIGAPGSNVTQAHMILGFYDSPEVEPLILDNLISDIRPASRRPDLTPVFSFNSDGVWMPGATSPTSSVERLSRWKDLFSRMRVEGYEP